jgi:hypothetical protein
MLSAMGQFDRITFATGATVQQVLADTSDREAPDARQTLQYAAWLTTEDMRAARTSV